MKFKHRIDFKNEEDLELTEEDINTILLVDNNQEETRELKIHYKNGQVEVFKWVEIEKK